MKQLVFPFVIDTQATKRNVERALAQASTFNRLFARREMQITPSYVLHEGSSKSGSNQLEQVATWNVDMEGHYNKVCSVLKLLAPDERDIVWRYYFKDDQDTAIYLDLNLTERTYYRVKSAAIYSIAASLNLLVFVGEAS